MSTKASFLSSSGCIFVAVVMAISLLLTRASAEYTALQKKQEMRQALDFMTWLDTLELSIVDQEGVLDAGVVSSASSY